MSEYTINAICNAYVTGDTCIATLFECYIVWIRTITSNILSGISIN